MTRVRRSGPAPGRLLAVAGGLLLLSLPLFPNDLQAWGNNLAATSRDCGRDWSGISCIRRAMPAALSPPAGELKPTYAITPGS